MNAAAADEFPRLIFDWDPPHRRDFTMLGFVTASFLGHAFCFYLFQIVYPPTIAILPPPARVSVISPSSEEGRNLLYRIEAEDPALAFATQRPPESRLRALPKVEHVPSYLANEPAIQQLPPLIMDLHVPSAQPPGPVSIIHPKPPPRGREFSTTVLFSDELAAIGAATCSHTKFTVTTHEPPQAVQFRVAVNARGEIQHCFTINSSGDAALDEQARQHLVLCRFPVRSTAGKTDEGSVTWGLATVEWGTDIDRPRANSGAATSAQ
ncbi:MAG TPA: hypothetical protein VFO30_04775 [Chthoniobacterales bacterium]|nr:hypothetical protein [Chthoniobacterales bacterium]